MMKKSWRIVFLFLCGLMTISCSSSDDEIDEEWRSENVQVFLKISSDNSYREIKSASNNGSIYVKEIKKGEGTVSPYFTSSVKVCYTGHLGTALDEDPFDSVELPYQNPSKRLVSGFVDGFSTALQWMKEGDRWEVWIPYQLAYGAGGHNDIPAYTTLRFEMELVQIVKQ